MSSNGKQDSDGSNSPARETSFKILEDLNLIQNVGVLGNRWQKFHLQQFSEDRKSFPQNSKSFVPRKSIKIHGGHVKTFTDTKTRLIESKYEAFTKILLL